MVANAINTANTNGWIQTIAAYSWSTNQIYKNAIAKAVARTRPTPIGPTVVAVTAAKGRLGSKFRKWDKYRWHFTNPDNPDAERYDTLPNTICGRNSIKRINLATENLYEVDCKTCHRIYAKELGLVPGI